MDESSVPAKASIVCWRVGICHHIKQKHFRDLRNEDPFPLNLYLSHDPLILATNSHRPYQVVLEKLCLGQWSPETLRFCFIARVTWLLPPSLWVLAVGRLLHRSPRTRREDGKMGWKISPKLYVGRGNFPTTSQITRSYLKGVWRSWCFFVEKQDELRRKW